MVSRNKVRFCVTVYAHEAELFSRRAVHEGRTLSSWAAVGLRWYYRQLKPQAEGAPLTEKK
jgi:hypothetical protein